MTENLLIKAHSIADKFVTRKQSLVEMKSEKKSKMKSFPVKIGCIVFEIFNRDCCDFFSLSFVLFCIFSLSFSFSFFSLSLFFSPPLFCFPFFLFCAPFLSFLFFVFIFSIFLFSLSLSLCFLFFLCVFFCHSFSLGSSSACL